MCSCFSIFLLNAFFNRGRNADHRGRLGGDDYFERQAFAFDFPGDGNFAVDGAEAWFGPGHAITNDQINREDIKTEACSFPANNPALWARWDEGRRGWQQGGRAGSHQLTPTAVAETDGAGRAARAASPKAPRRPRLQSPAQENIGESPA